MAAAEEGAALADTDKYHPSANFVEGFAHFLIPVFILGKGGIYVKKKFTFKQVAVFLIVFILVITTTLGILALQQQKLNHTTSAKGNTGSTYISILDNFTVEKTKEDVTNSDFVKILMKNAILFILPLVIFAICIYAVVKIKVLRFSGIPVRDNVVLIE